MLTLGYWVDNPFVDTDNLSRASKCVNIFTDHMLLIYRTKTYLKPRGKRNYLSLVKITTYHHVHIDDTAQAINNLTLKLESHMANADSQLEQINKCNW